jgi:putative glycerol-1-phosphate prenyltransferase|tara:strand:- start:203 stop:961 length:759 start_codon:yes stop_codon:yes gene_type:complete
MMNSKVFNHLLSVRKKKGAGYIVLIDPDKKSENDLQEKVKSINDSGVDAIFVGGSLMMDGRCSDRVSQIKSLAEIPVIFFPGGISQLNSHYDAILFMSIISGRNPHYLIGEQVIAAPIINDLGIEVIPTGYLLLDGGSNSAVQFMSGTAPIPMDKPDISIAHALAAQYLGKQLIYLEAGSGAKQAVTNELIKKVFEQVDIPMIVGGGIRTPEVAREKVESGASFVVTGTIIEENNNGNILKNFAEAVHVNET